MYTITLALGAQGTLGTHCCRSLPTVMINPQARCFKTTLEPFFTISVCNPSKTNSTPCLPAEAPTPPMENAIVMASLHNRTAVNALNRQPTFSLNLASPVKRVLRGLRSTVCLDIQTLKNTGHLEYTRWTC